jgi:hypothetical protein
MTADPPTPRARLPRYRRVHLAKLISATGAVSPACARESRAINMQRDTWSTDPSAVTCQGCLKAAADRAVEKKP